MKASNVAFWIARILAAVIMSQTLYFKFSGAEESIQLFTQLGAEPWGRYGTGIFELLASILIIVPSTVWIGSLLSIGLMTGAILSHIAVIGIARDDGGQLFIYAVVVFACAIFSFWKSKNQVPAPLKTYLPLFLK
ncbi:MAG TPA: DoxX family protein [Cyclobacteriaceae bacterium]|nr:DoxX family protein [Cyclobacteriaceae bacterium]